MPMPDATVPSSTLMRSGQTTGYAEQAHATEIEVADDRIVDRQKDDVANDSRRLN
jgi:hypothetical protein